MRITILIICSFMLFACQPDQQATGTDEKNSEPQSKVKIEGADDGDAPSPTLFMVDDDSDRFPYLQPLNDSTIKMAAYTVRLEAVHDYPLRPLVPERTPWFNEVFSNESQGVFLSYVIAGRRLMLSEPNIRVDYINKTNPYYSSIDSAILSVEDFYMIHPDSKYLKERNTLKTRQGRDIEVIEVFAKRDTLYTPKYQAFGYMDYNDDYIVSIHLTTLDKYEFKDALPFYYRLLRGIKAVDR